MKRFLFFLLLLFGFGCNIDTQAQTTDEQISQNQLRSIVLHYYKINFTAEQRKTLKGVLLECIYEVDTIGKLSLVKINGVDGRPDIADSIRAATLRLAPVKPYQHNGLPVIGIYSIEFNYPQYQPAVVADPWFFSYKTRKTSDFKYINATSLGLAMSIGISNMLPIRQQYVGNGGGFTFQFDFTSRKRWGIGASMTGHFLDARKNYPITTTHPFYDNRNTLMLGLNYYYSLTNNIHSRRDCYLQIDLAYAEQILTEQVADTPNTNWQIGGFSIGGRFNYGIQLGKTGITSYYLSPIVQKHYLNFHIGLHPVFMDIPQANNLMISAGVSWCLRLLEIDSYLLKE